MGKTSQTPITSGSSLDAVVCQLAVGVDADGLRQKIMDTLAPTLLAHVTESAIAEEILTQTSGELVDALTKAVVKRVLHEDELEHDYK